MRILIAGAGGMVGRALLSHCQSLADDVFAYDRSQLDIADEHAVRNTIREMRPSAVINCAAWTDVDSCENDAARSDAINAHGPANLSKASREVDAGFVTISTDYVFDGDKEGFYTQDDLPNPISAYGRSKLRGEQESLLANPAAIVVRSGFIFGSGGKNFLSKVAKPIAQGLDVTAISDAWGTPTYAGDLAKRLRELATLRESGIYHVVNEGPGASYVDFTMAVAEALGKDPSRVKAVPSSSLQRAAPRPRNSRLKCLISAPRGLRPLPFWRDALHEHLSSAGFTLATD